MKSDAEKGPLVEEQVTRESLVRLHSLLWRRLALHRHHHGREPKMQTAQRRDGLPLHSQPSSPKLVYHEVRRNQSAALKREVAIKAMNRAEKLSMIRRSKKSIKA